MKAFALALGVLLYSAGRVQGQSPPGPVGVASVAGVDIEYRCTPVPEGAQRFYVEAVFSNSGIVRAPDLPSYTVPLPGLVPGMAGVSNGTGTGDPIGAFTFRSRWSGYQPRFVIAATNDVFATDNGDLYADELFTRGSEADPPNMRFDGSFTFKGGTRRYQQATGSAEGVAQQLGDGVRTAFVACGWIDGIDGPSSTVIDWVDGRLGGTS